MCLVLFRCLFIHCYRYWCVLCLHGKLHLTMQLHWHSWHHHSLDPANEDATVHGYYNNRDQLGYQDQNFRGRTSLFQDQISRGTASLQLTGVKVQYQGRYECYTSTTSKQFVTDVQYLQYRTFASYIMFHSSRCSHRRSLTFWLLFFQYLKFEKTLCMWPFVELKRSELFQNHDMIYIISYKAKPDNQIKPFQTFMEQQSTLKDHLKIKHQKIEIPPVL